MFLTNIIIVAMHTWLKHFTLTHIPYGCLFIQKISFFFGVGVVFLCMFSWVLLALLYDELYMRCTHTYLAQQHFILEAIYVVECAQRDAKRNFGETEEHYRCQINLMYKFNSQRDIVIYNARITYIKVLKKINFLYMFL